MAIIVPIAITDDRIVITQLNFPQILFTFIHCNEIKTKTKRLLSIKTFSIQVDICHILDKLFSHCTD